ncbi:UNVERIFIED_CONTAM: hypothetical protein Sangu_2764100 [Sesamum angustifolium]|uniref:Retrotransposon gag domain-containing protein n=1 Tax=Sesamum angustifolium TaxID=2727405 RepID=A0AAW2IWE0_9LAMI
MANPLQRNTSSDTSMEEISPALLGAIQQIVSAAILEQVAVLAPARVATPSSVNVPEEEAKEGVLDIQYQNVGPLKHERQGVPFTEVVIVDELPANCRIPAIAEYAGTTNPKEHLSCFENAALLHRYTDVQQKENEPLKEYLQRFNAATLEVPFATQEVKANAFSQGLLDGDFFKSLAKKLVSKCDALLARTAKYINMEDAQAAKKESR